jgi:glutamine---fructose-6-phosphate transaminase (isomerizing)
MCSVVGYIGNQVSRAYILDGLARLEYRGYDSAGFSCFDTEKKQLLCVKAVGGVAQLTAHINEQPINGFSGIGHTRWSTHGTATVENAHPHTDCLQKISLVHNGIIENYLKLKHALLEEGHVFSSQTDSEVIAHLLEHELKRADLVQSTCALVAQLEGAYAVACLLEQYPDTLLLIRHKSPLCIGISSHGMFAGSDPLAFAGHVQEIVYMPEASFAIIKKNGLELYNFAGQRLDVIKQSYTAAWEADGKRGHEHYMLKEIYEQKRVIQTVVQNFRTRFAQTWNLALSPEQIKALASIQFIAAGTSWHAAYIAQFFIESIAQMPVRVHLASEFRSLPFFSELNTVFIAISQSGETADTLESIRFLPKSVHTIALTNTPLSSLVRETNGAILMDAGTEIAVASTKAFTAQIASLYLLAHYIAHQKQIITNQALDQAEIDLLLVSEILESLIERYKQEIISTWAPRYASYKQAIFLGRHISYPFAREAALKLKEITYIFTDSYPAGELKHGSIALIDSSTPVFIFSVLDPDVYKKLLSNAQEVKARSGHLVVFAFEGQEELIALADCVFIIPVVKPLLGVLAMTGLMQFLVYHIARELKRPIDKPRNLAKSVTVE